MLHHVAQSKFLMRWWHDRKGERGSGPPQGKLDTSSLGRKGADGLFGQGSTDIHQALRVDKFKSYSHISMVFDVPYIAIIRYIGYNLSSWILHRLFASLIPRSLILVYRPFLKCQLLANLCDMRIMHTHFAILYVGSQCINGRFVRLLRSRQIGDIPSMMHKLFSLSLSVGFSMKIYCFKLFDKSCAQSLFLILPKRVHIPRPLWSATQSSGARRLGWRSNFPSAAIPSRRIRPRSRRRPSSWSATCRPRCKRPTGTRDRFRFSGGVAIQGTL